MHTLPSQTELLKAYTILFGQETNASVNFTKYLQPVVLKTAYKKKAFETHPDRAKVLGKPGYGMDETFREIRRAYEMLIPFIGKRKFAHHTVSAKKKHSATHHCTDTSDHFFSGKIPERRLLIGQFLYYSKFISWKTFIKAVVWQRQKRPKIGQIAIDWGMLDPPAIMNILQGKNFSEKFGDFALRIGYITRFEHFALIGKQKNLQPPIGEYFIRNKILSASAMAINVKKQKNHNRISIK
jgi:hypothetical protein